MPQRNPHPPPPKAATNTGTKSSTIWHTVEFSKIAHPVTSARASVTLDFLFDASLGSDSTQAGSDRARPISVSKVVGCPRDSGRFGHLSGVRFSMPGQQTQHYTAAPEAVHHPPIGPGTGRVRPVQREVGGLLTTPGGSAGRRSLASLGAAAPSHRRWRRLG